MMKQINGRFAQKIDSEVNWNKATNFIPMAGEIIIYKKDSNYNYDRIKIGDGETTVINLPFVKELPQVSTVDVGKFLRVSANGVWAAETIARAEEAEF